jgi:predicted enzyme related to lactoylglutathione lyase
MESVQGIGGIFLRAKDREALGNWYKANLGLDINAAWWGTSIRWADQHAAAEATTVWSLFADDTEYFGPNNKTFMINFRVRDLGAMLAQLRAAGCDVDTKTEDSEFGKFGWVTDPEGNRVELWEPPAKS